MKRLVTLFLIPLFLFATTIGLTMVSHYCGGKLASKGISIKACCKDVKKGGCCQTKSEIVKVKDAFLKTSYHIHLNSFVGILPAITEISFLSSFHSKTYVKWSWDKAPPYTSKALYILYRAIII